MAYVCELSLMELDPLYCLLLLLDVIASLSYATWVRGAPPTPDHPFVAPLFEGSCALRHPNGTLGLTISGGREVQIGGCFLASGLLWGLGAFGYGELFAVRAVLIGSGGDAFS